MKKKIISIIGARPNFIKLAALQPLLGSIFNHVIIHTGQHYDYDLSQAFFDELAIPQPDFNLGVGSATHGLQTAKMLAACEKILIKEKPKMVLVYGDTNSTLAGALAAAKLNIPVAHIEAGLRSFDKSMPEEINRILTDHLSNLLFCPSMTSKDNLAKEGIRENVFFTGDIAYSIFQETKINNDVLTKYRLKSRNYYFATVHRQENTDDSQRLRKILKIFASLNQTVVMPLHPRTRNAIAKYGFKPRNVKLLKPQGYSYNIALAANSTAILTDSGGVQKEAYWLKVPCLTMRNSSEWPETVKSGWNKLVDTDLQLTMTYLKNLAEPKPHPNYFFQKESPKVIAKIIASYIS